MDMNLSKLWEMGVYREAWHAAVHGVAKSWTWLSDWTELNWTVARQAPLSVAFSRQEYWSELHFYFLLQEIFLTQELKSCFLLCRRIFFYCWATLLAQFNPVAQSCPTLCNPMDCSTPGFPVHHQLPELAQTHAHQVSDTIQPSHSLLSPSLLTFNISQHQGIFQWVSSSHQVARVLEFQLQHQSFQWIFRTDFL